MQIAVIHEPVVGLDLSLREVVQVPRGEGIEDELQLAAPVDQVNLRPGPAGLAKLGDVVVAVAPTSLVVGDYQTP